MEFRFNISLRTRKERDTWEYEKHLEGRLDVLQKENRSLQAEVARLTALHPFLDPVAGDEDRPTN